MPRIGRRLGTIVAVALLGIAAAAMALPLHGRKAAVTVLAGTMSSNDQPDDPAEDLNVVALSDRELAERGIARRPLGDLVLGSGTIVTADPLVQPDRPAYARTVTPGLYPVTLYRAQQRVALAELRFAPGAPTRWEIATLPGQDAGTLKAGEIFGYGVDAGLGCFMSVEGRQAFLEREKQEQARLGAKFDNIYDDLISDLLASNGGNDVLFRPLADNPANVAIFQSGWGDGFYASYWGLDEAGRALALVTDFQVIEHGDGRTPQERWTQGQVAAMTPEQRRDSAAGYAALQTDDLARLEALLKQGRITPETAIEGADVPFTYVAVALNKPAALDLMVRYGASRTIPRELGTSWNTYGDFARSYARTKPDGTPEYNWLKPHSPTLMAVIERWDAEPRQPR